MKGFGASSNKGGKTHPVKGTYMREKSSGLYPPSASVVKTA